MNKNAIMIIDLFDFEETYIIFKMKKLSPHKIFKRRIITSKIKD